MAAKRTSEIIPLCHNVPLAGVEIEVEMIGGRAEEMVRKAGANARNHEPAVDVENGALRFIASVTCHGQTGVEMEALNAASAAVLTAYDMCKAVDKGMRVDGLRVVKKEGGRNGTWVEGRNVDDSNTEEHPSHQKP